NSAENRGKFKSDVETYMDRYGLSENERRLIQEQDWLNLVKSGGNVYNVIRIAAQFGIGLYPMGAQQLGLSYEEFLATRNVKGAT
ncbi:MAG: protocatechuate 3,4-dioxygenase, partial [Proteobacteria bacterium]|nr:protocatechuate 3,4-dioxygenase [Pseudomonadota bacterium]